MFKDQNIMKSIRIINIIAAISVILFLVDLNAEIISIYTKSTASQTHFGLKLCLSIAFILISLLLFAMLSHLKRSYLAAEFEKKEKEVLIDSIEIELESRKASLKEITELYNKTVELNNLKAEFFSNMSHEFKTPLTVILGALQLIDKTIIPGSPDRRKSDKQINAIRQNCYRLLRLANNILDITRIESGFIKVNVKHCNIVYLVEEITQSVVLYAEQKNLYMEFDTEVEEIFTSVDVDKIERVILNLLSNAIKFTAQGGKISVSVAQKENEVAISIKDTGVGIPTNMQKAIFERFKQVNNSLTRQSEGSGIGLSIVKSFVELHNGCIKVNSEENKGSEFIIELPINLSESEHREDFQPCNEHTKIIEAINIEFSDIYSIAS